MQKDPECYNQKKSFQGGGRLLERLKRIIAVVGHYGSGKTNLAVNLAADLAASGRDVALADLDIVNPYFRSADFTAQMQAKGVEMIVPPYARSNLDIPALPARMDGAIDGGKTLVLDIGGDDAGAAALGRYSPAIREAGGCDLLYVVNRYRYLTRTAGEAEEILKEIEAVARLTVTGVVNNSNLADETTAQVIADSFGYAEEAAARCGAPLLFTTVKRPLAEELQKLANDRELYPVDIYVKKPWEE